ncbi:MAG: type III polyketide synthase [Bacteroidota bacterium]
MAKIISIATEVPAHKHLQGNLLAFMEAAYGAGEKEKRILKHLYNHSGIDTRYSVIPDFTLPQDQWEFFPRTPDLEPFPNLDHRMQWFSKYALPLSLASANKCINGVIEKDEITHLITVSCTGMSAPGLELQLMEAMDLNANTSRSAVNFMGCYAAIHGLKNAADIVNANPAAKVLVVCTELCSLHFQKVFTQDAITAPLLFADGSAAVLICADDDSRKGVRLDSFYAEVLKDAKDSMSWKLSSMGFVMTLASDVPDIFRADIGQLKDRALAKAGLSDDEVKYWCIHPGGKRILEAIGKGLNLTEVDLAASAKVLREYGNMSSATVLFVLKEMWDTFPPGEHAFAAAFGPGLTMESIILTKE